MSESNDDRVSRRRYIREQKAREEAELLLEHKSRELFEANQELSKHSERLEAAVLERTRELRLALEQAEAASAARSRFIATMSHEIRTPLAGLLGMIDLLALDERDAEKLELLNNAQVSGQALGRIVNDVLDFSKMEAGLFAFESEAVDIRALAKSVLVLAQTNLKGADRVIEAQIDSSVPQLFMGDGTRIRQVISNLVSNAVRYSKKGPITIAVTSSQHEKGALLRLEVQDFGVGIAEDQIQNLFKDFSQISNSLTAAAQGTGLGLAISKRIIEGCGGTIGVVSQEGKGSTFWIELPVEVISPPDIEPEKVETFEPIDASILAGRRILLAEDNPINQKLLLTYLKRMDVEAELAENGQIAVDMFEPDKFDLVLMDVAMPVMDGLSAIRHIRQQWEAHEIPPIMVLTAHVMDAIEEEAAQVGVDNVLNKPIPFDQLRTSLSEALKGRSPLKEKALAEQAEQTGVGIPSVAALMAPDVVEDLLDTFSPEELANLVSSYVTQSEDLVDSIGQNFSQNEEKRVSEEAHSLKGSSLLLGFNDIAKAAAEIEKTAASITQDHLRSLSANILENLELIKEKL